MIGFILYRDTLIQVSTKGLILLDTSHPLEYIAEYERPGTTTLRVDADIPYDMLGFKRIAYGHIIVVYEGQKKKEALELVSELREQYNL